MKKSLSVVLVALFCAGLSFEAAAANSLPRLKVIRGITHVNVSGTQCPDGAVAEFKKKKYWCPIAADQQVTLKGRSYQVVSSKHCSDGTKAKRIEKQYWCAEELVADIPDADEQLSGVVDSGSGSVTVLDPVVPTPQPLPEAATPPSELPVDNVEEVVAGSDDIVTDTADTGVSTSLPDNETSTGSGQVVNTPPPIVAPTTYSVQLSWTPPSTRANGTALSMSDLAKYEIYYTSDDLSASQAVIVSGGNVTSYTISALQAGTYHFAISAIDSNGLKSVLSTMVSTTLGQ